MAAYDLYTTYGAESFIRN